VIGVENEESKTAIVIGVEWRIKNCKRNSVENE
jgi:hypothetical protein